MSQRTFLPVPVPTGVLSRLWGATESLPQSVEAARRAFVPGEGSRATEWFSLPKLALLLAGGIALRQWTRPPSKKLQKERTCDEKYCPPEAWTTHVDRPINTLLKDQSLGAGLSLPVKNATLAVPYQKTKADYYREAMMSPGVKLVAHAVA